MSPPPPPPQSPPVNAVPVKRNKGNSSIKRSSVWTITYSPKEDVHEMPKLVRKFIKKFARKWCIVNERADKFHVQGTFITRNDYHRSWGDTHAKRLCKKLGLKPKAILIHPHGNLSGSIGYLDGKMIMCRGFDKKQIKAAVADYKARLEGKYYRAHVNSMIKLVPQDVSAMRQLVEHKLQCDPEEAERHMQRMGHIWAGMKDASTFVAKCMLNDALLK